MGASYASCLAFGATVDEVRQAVSPRTAFVGQASETVVVVLDRNDDEDPGDGTLASELSATLRRRVLDVVVVDDDLIALELFSDGELRADLSVGEQPLELADAEAFADVLELRDPQALHRALSQPSTTATEVHSAVLVVLGLPEALAGWGFGYVERDRGATYRGPALQRLGSG